MVCDRITPDYEIANVGASVTRQCLFNYCSLERDCGSLTRQ